MEGLGGLLALLAVICILSGPIALIVSLVALKRLKEVQRDLDEWPAPPRQRPFQVVPTTVPERLEPVREAAPWPVEEAKPRLSPECLLGRCSRRHGWCGSLRRW